MPAEQEVSLHFSDYWRVIRNRWPIIVTVFILVVATAFFYTRSVPKIYSSSAIVKVDRRNQELEVWDQSPDLFDPVFFQTEYEIIGSSKILYSVIEELDLKNLWKDRFGADEGMEITNNMVYQLLTKKYLDVHPYRNTKLIEIACENEDPIEAARIANKIAQVYQNYRVSEIEGRAKAGLKAVKEELDRQRERLTEAKKVVEKLRRESGLDALAGSTHHGATWTIQDLEVQKKETLLTEAKADYLARKARMEELDGLTTEELAEAFPSLGLHYQTIEAVKQGLVEEKQNLDSLKKEGLVLENHPTMLAAKQKVETYKLELEKAVKGAMRGLEADLKASQAKWKALDDETKQLREDLRASKSGQVAPYEEALQELETQQTVYDLHLQRYHQLYVDSQVGVDPVDIITQAEPGIEPIKPIMALNILLGVGVSLIMGVSLAFFIEYLDTSVKSLDDVERFMGSTVVGVIPEGVSSLNLEGPDSPNAESYRILRAKIDLKSKEDGAKTLTVVSGGPGEGKTTTLFNLAYVCAYSGIRTLLIDTDFRRHEINRILGITNEKGLADYLLGKQQLFNVIRETEIPNLHVITAGDLPSASMGALNPQRMQEIISTLKPRYDVILFDSPPILGISDAAVIVHEVDLTLLVIQHRRYPRNISLRAKRVIEEVQGKLFGVVLNKVHVKSDESYYYYTSHYSYHGGKTQAIRNARKKAKMNKKRLKARENQKGTEGDSGSSSEATTPDRY